MSDVVFYASLDAALESAIIGLNSAKNKHQGQPPVAPKDKFDDQQEKCR